MSVFEKDSKLQELHQTLIKAQKLALEVKEEEGSSGSWCICKLLCVLRYESKRGLDELLEFSIEWVEQHAIHERIRQIDPKLLKARAERLERLNLQDNP